MIPSSNLPSLRWGDMFSDHVVDAAMIDRNVHHAEVLTLTGNSYRLRKTDIDTLPYHRAGQPSGQPASDSQSDRR